MWGLLPRQFPLNFGHLCVVHPLQSLAAMPEPTTRDDASLSLELDAPIAIPDNELKPGAVVGDYEITGKLGQGGMGIVYSAVHPLIGKRAAIKVIHPRLCQDPTSVHRFVQEARSVNRIGHPNIVDVFALGQLEDGRSYLVMEWLEGETLCDLLRRGRPPLRDGLHVLAQIADALQAAHERGVIHRDLKPDNILLVPLKGQGDQVKLLDFGIAKLTCETAPIAQTDTGVLLGTPGYMSPEQARGKDIDARTDLYALGAIAYEVILGRPPYEADNAMDKLLAHCTEPVPEPRALWPEMPELLNDLIVSLLAKSRRQRPSIDEVRDALALLLTGQLADAPLPLFAPIADTTGVHAATTAVDAPTTTSGQVIATDTYRVPAPWRPRALVGVSAVLGTMALAALAFATRAGGEQSRQSDEAPVAAHAVATPAAADSNPAHEPAEPGPPQPVAPPPARSEMPSSLAVRVNVRDAVVELDGEPISLEGGTTRVEFADGGEHELEVHADGYEMARRMVEVPRGTHVVLDVDLRRVPTPVARRRVREHKTRGAGNYTLNPFR